MQKHLRIIIILCLISSLARFVLESYLPSMPAISKSLGVSAASVQFTMTLYLLGFSLSQLVYGPLSDRFGRRIVILIGLCILVAGNFLCCLATSKEMLLFARLIAGIGAGACGVLNRAIASDCFKGAEFSRVWSYTTTTLVITLSATPLLGGYIQELWGWRANFILATIIVAIVLWIIFSFLPETNCKINKKINKIENASLTLGKIIKDYYSIFITPSFITGSLCYTLAFSGLIAYFQVSPLLLINEIGLSPSEYGWCSLIIAANYLIGGLLVSKYASRMRIENFLLIGTLLLIAGGFIMLLSYFMHSTTIAGVLLPASIYVIGARIVIPNAIAGSMEKVRHLSGSSSALIGFIQMLGSSLISFAIATFSNKSSFTLAMFLTVLGIVTFTASLLNKSVQRKLSKA